MRWLARRQIALVDPEDPHELVSCGESGPELIGRCDAPSVAAIAFHPGGGGAATETEPPVNLERGCVSVSADLRL
jgi:hypothetical protein